MASQYFSLKFLIPFLFFSFSSSELHSSKNSITPISTPPPPSPSPNIPVEIQGACKASRDPPTCESALTDPSQFPSNLIAIQIILSALSISSQNLTSVKSLVKNILDTAAGNMNLTVPAKNCLLGFDFVAYRYNLTAAALTRGEIKDARAWTSAALGYQIGCSSNLLKVNGTHQVAKTVEVMKTLIGFTTNALWMMVNYDIYGNDTRSWGPPKTERDGFWEVGSGFGSWFGLRGGFPSGLNPNLTVCKTGGCDYKMVQEAVNATPGYFGSEKFVIWIKTGLYDEIIRVPLEKRNVVFLGDGMGKTVITGSLSVGLVPGMTTYESATVGVSGDGFMASGLTIQNTAGIGAGQAVAFRSDSDLSVIQNCEFLGNQDTLYTQSLRQYYQSCHIQGNVDFIFGNAAAFFQDCDILITPRLLNPEKGETNAVTAHGRLDPGQSTGFVFQSCSINGTEEYMNLYRSNPKVHKNFLGRPWKEYSRTIFIYCNLEVLVHPEGWMPWNGEFALKTLYYGEFNSSGAGANVTGRVTWSSQIPAEHIDSYSVKNFIQGDKWIPPTSC
ncbi:probable pectinesterase/pectinesterase inhibitor 51 [Lycium ferocissimum]|uniref:probable pectinesterase/pectinesterase inhibitor 51 n=1 Tax=Lycium ferocissimum TaxID=112874 RepID=UPI002814B659|nr:probable pectinesterase/pectinesterase inhibitor 51 [Lycium ferocissimum]